MQRVTILVLAGLAAASWHAAAADSDTATAKLSDDTRALLVEEMQAVSGAMGPLHTALVQGEHGVVADYARRIHDSFVLAQRLEPAQKEEIHTRLPAAFVAMDRRFHALAAELAAAARAHRSDLERFYFDEMTRACLACHSHFAAGRFPGLANGQGGEDAH